MDQLSIAIAGCGPAGLAASILLHRQGHSVTIFDQFDSPGPVGSGLMIQPSGLAVLDQLGLADKVMMHGARIDALSGFEEHGKKVLDAPYSKLGKPDAFGIGIHRASLFSILYEAALDKGIVIETGHCVTGSHSGAQGRSLTFDTREETRPFDLIVDASGRRTVFDNTPDGTLDFGALWASLPFEKGGPFAGNLLEQRYRRAAQMVGVLPIGKRNGASEPEVAFFWSLKRADYPSWCETPLDKWKEEVKVLWPETHILLDRIQSREQLTFARYSYRTLKSPIAERMIAIGDAWHSTSPQLGQGANMALLDAWALSRGLQEGSNLAEKLRLAVGSRRDHVLLYQWVTKLFTPLYQSDTQWQPMLRDRLLAPLSQLWPASTIQAQLMSGLFGFPLEQLGLSIPNYESLWANASRI